MFGSGADGPLGLLAGSGELPLLFARAARGIGRDVVVVGIEGHTDRRIEAFAKSAHYVPLARLSEVPRLLKSANVRRVALAGGLPKGDILFGSGKDDEGIADVVKRTKNRGDDNLLRAVEIYLKLKCGVSVVDSRTFLKEALAVKGDMSGRAATREEIEDMKFGLGVVRATGRLDIGQTVVVKQGTVLAVEAIEGTDAAIRRGGELGKGGAVVVKAAKPNQDLRFDLPCVGPDTLESMKASGCRALGVEAGKTLMLSKEEFTRRAGEAGIAIVGLP